MKTPLLHLLIPLIQAFIVRSDNCPSLPINNLTCYNDFNQNITCEWDSTYLSHHRDARCKLHANKIPISTRFASRALYSASCDLKPVDISNPARQKCSLIFKMDYAFLTYQEWSIDVSCEPVKQSVTILYKPSCHIKVNPPGKPNVNITTVSWLNYITEHERIKEYKAELQWKPQDQPWSDSSVQNKKPICNKREWEAELDPDLLIQGEMYEARVRVQATGNEMEGTWSDWSPTTSWLSPVGRTKPPSGIAVGLVHMIVGGVALFALLLAVILFKTNKTTWVYIVKRIRGPPLPNPADFLQDSWLTPHFTSDSFHSFLKPVEILPVEVTSTVDVVAPCKPDEKTLKNIDTCKSTSSSFSNPSYSELCTAPPPPPPPPPPVLSLTPGNLEPCAADSPYGPVGSQGEERNVEQDDLKLRERDMEILKLLSKGGGSSSSSSSNSEPLQVDLDYKKTGQVQAERFRLQSLDSGMCSCEEVSQESMEVDSINISDSHEEELEDEEQNKGGNVQKLAFEKLFGFKGGVFGKDSITVCSDYEQVQNLQADSPELPSLDSGVNSGCEEHQEEIMEGADKPTEMTRFLFPPPPSIASPCSSLPLPQLPLNFSAPAMSPALRPPLSHMLNKIVRMSSGNSVEPSGDGYLPVRQEQC